jgi:hypothetical protein
VLVLAGLSIDLAGGRWGAYIPSPIPGVYLADLLVGLGALGALAGLKLVRGYRPILFVAFGLAAAYLAIRGLDSLVLRPAPDRYLVIRDLAPFGYLLLVPFMGIVLTSVSWAAFIWVVRIATSLHLLGVVLQGWGWITIPSSNLGQLSGTAVVFPGRGDLLGVIFGIAFLAWGKWPGVLPASRIAQFLVLVFGFNQGSRAAFVTLIFCIAFEIWRERKLGQMRVLLAVTAAGIAASILIPWAQTTQPQTTHPQVGAVAKQMSVNGAGTNKSRIDSWSDVLRSFTVGTNFVFGGEIGSQDYFLFVCTGERIAKYLDRGEFIPGVINSGGNTPVKCMIDHGWDAVPVRDPHNWFLNMMLYHGIVGTGIWLFGFGAVFWVTRRVKNGSLAVISIGAYFVCGTFQVIMSAPFALLPTAVFLAWLLSRYLLGGDNLRAPSSEPKKAVTSSG